MRKRKVRQKPLFKAPAPRKAPQVHRPARGKGSYRRRARTLRREAETL